MKCSNSIVKLFHPTPDAKMALHWNLEICNKPKIFSLSNNLFSEQAAKNRSVFFFPCDVADGKFPFKRIRSRVAAGTERSCLRQISLLKGDSSSFIFSCKQKSNGKQKCKGMTVVGSAWPWIVSVLTLHYWTLELRSVARSETGMFLSVSPNPFAWCSEWNNPRSLELESSLVQTWVN